VREEHRASQRDGPLSLRVAEERRAAERALDHQPVGIAARGVVPAVGRAALPFLGGGVNDGERIEGGGGDGHRPRDHILHRGNQPSALAPAREAAINFFPTSSVRITFRGFLLHCFP